MLIGIVITITLLAGAAIIGCAMLADRCATLRAEVAEQRLRAEAFERHAAREYRMRMAAEARERAAFRTLEQVPVGQRFRMFGGLSTRGVA